MSKQITLQDAIRLNNQGIKNIAILEADNPRANEFVERMTIHTEWVAKAAAIIAKQVGLDIEKAQIYGLLHDYGKYFGDAQNKTTFHGIIGYEEMKKLGYNDVAKICLTHTFSDKNFPLSEYSTYNHKHLLQTKEILKSIEYDDYDKLLQLSDLLVKLEGGFDTIETRFIRLKRVYNISDEATNKKILEANNIKRYFEEKGNFNIYKALGLENE